MATLLRQRWTPRFEGMSRRDRQGCDYDAYLPDPLDGWLLTMPGDVAADISDAETAVRELNAAGTTHVSLEGLARFLLRAESVGSSRIEGLSPGARRLASAEAAFALGGEASDAVAVEVLGNIAAMELAVDQTSRVESFTLEDLLAIHRTLMERSPTPELAGVVRTEQNWIGGSAYNPCGAAYVPPPPENLPELVEDLVEYLNSDEHSPLVQAALAHAQFETLHPFADGNGRAGRALIHVVLRRRGLAPAFVPPISLVLASWSRSYIAGLTNFRHLGSPASPDRSSAAAEWLRLFATATRKACADSQRYAEEIATLAEGWRERLGRPRPDSSTERLLGVLPGVPIVTAESASAIIGRSKARTTDGINNLAEVGILRQRNVGNQRYRVFETPEVLDLFTRLEQSLASGRS